eukprot:1482726-Lingulodinium_polyedra.AAC.1
MPRRLRAGHATATPRPPSCSDAMLSAAAGDWPLWWAQAQEPCANWRPLTSARPSRSGTPGAQPRQGSRLLPSWCWDRWTASGAPRGCPLARAPLRQRRSAVWWPTRCIA